MGSLPEEGRGHSRARVMPFRRGERPARRLEPVEWGKSDGDSSIGPTPCPRRFDATSRPGRRPMGTDDDHAAWTSLVLLERFRAGDDLAAAEIFDRYFQRLTALARIRLSARIARRTDPEDVVLSAFRSFFVDARGGR